MRWSWLFLFVTMTAAADQKTESFIIQINDRSLKVVSPEVPRKLFAVVVENGSLSNQVGKFTINGQAVKFVSVLSGRSETVEIENRSGSAVTFVPVSPAFQDVELKFGKKAYEIPPKE